MIKIFEIKKMNLSLKKNKAFRNSKNRKLVYDERTEEQKQEFEQNKNKSFDEKLNEYIKRR